MAYLNVKERMLEAKIVYYGAGLSGKTTNLEVIKQQTQEGRCGDMMSLNTAGDRTLFFDWLPFNMGKVNGCDIKVQLYTVPGQARYAETRRRVLAGADGIVLVLDSQSGALDKNKEILTDLREHMRLNRLSPDRVPIVYQLNKRDLPSAMTPAELLEALGLAGKPYLEAVASLGKGVFETLQEITRLVLASVREQARSPGATVIQSGTSSNLDGHTLYTQLVAGGNPLPETELPQNGSPRAENVSIASSIEPAALSKSDVTSSLTPTIMPPPSVLSGVIQQSQSSSAASQPSTTPVLSPSPSPTPVFLSFREGEAKASVRSAVPSQLVGSSAPNSSPDSRPINSPESLPHSSLHEIIGILRTLTRRVDALESSLVQKVTTLFLEQNRAAHRTQEEFTQQITQISERVEQLGRLFSKALEDQPLALTEQVTKIQAAVEEASTSLRVSIERISQDLADHSRHLEEKPEQIATRASEYVSEQLAERTEAIRRLLDVRAVRLEEAMTMNVEGVESVKAQTLQLQEQNSELRNQLCLIGDQLARKVDAQIEELHLALQEQAKNSKDQAKKIAEHLEKHEGQIQEGLTSLRQGQVAQLQGMNERLENLEKQLHAMEAQKNSEQESFEEQLKLRFEEKLEDLWTRLQEQLHAEAKQQREEASTAWMFLDGKLGRIEQTILTSQTTLQMLEEKQPELEKALQALEKALEDILSVVQGTEQQFQSSAQISSRVVEMTEELTKAVDAEKERLGDALGRIEALREPMTSAIQALLDGKKELESMKHFSEEMSSTKDSIQTVLGAMSNATGAMKGSEKTMAVAATAMGEAARAMGEAAKASDEVTRLANSVARATGEEVKSIGGRIAEQDRWLLHIKEQLLLIETSMHQMLEKLEIIEKKTQGLHEQSFAAENALNSLKEGHNNLLVANQSQWDIAQQTLTSTRDALGHRLSELSDHLAVLGEDLRKKLKEAIQTLLTEITGIKGLVDERAVHLAKQGESSSVVLRDHLEKRLQALDAKIVAIPELKKMLQGATSTIVTECNASTATARDQLRELQQTSQHATLTLLEEVRQIQEETEEQLSRVEQGVHKTHGALDRCIQGMQEGQGVLERKISAALVALQEQFVQQQQGYGVQFRQVDEHLRQLLDLLRQTAEKKGWWRS